MSKIFDKLKKSGKSEPLQTERTAPSPKYLTTRPPTMEESNKIKKRLIIILSTGGVLIPLTAFLVPRLLLESEPPRREAPVMLLSQLARSTPQVDTVEPGMEIMVEEVRFPESNLQEIIEITPEPIKGMTDKAGEQTPSITQEASEAEGVPVVVVELVPSAPLTTEKLKEEKIEGEVTPAFSEEKKTVKEKTPEMAGKTGVKVEIIPKKEPLALPPDGEAVIPVAPEPELAEETIPPAKSAEGLVTTEHEVAQGLGRPQRGEKFKLALFYQKSGELKKAEAQYKELLKEDPMDSEVYNNLGAIYQELGDYDRAEVGFRKAVLIKPDYIKARNNLGVTLYKKGNLQGALREFQAILEVNPRDIHGLTNLGIVAKKIGDLFRAREAFRKVIEINPTHAEAHYNLAMVLEEEGEVAKAVFHYQKFLEFSNDKHTPLTEKVRRHLSEISKRGWK